MRDDSLLNVTRGTKGGRERAVPIGFKLAVLEEAADACEPQYRLNDPGAAPRI
ncbi:hypothetical protein AAGS40_29460 (plasmid) [Paraburkholderia sp. PREW-6R]|uniref:hypothetical protein n=1 Tax=Paraburkholderia sp. PREW-6R TaxID=3141544 RepID=UPI0031F4E78F